MQKSEIKIDLILNLIKKAIPKPIFNFFQPAYHFLLAFAAALFYGFPSRKMFVVGVTGTKGKTTTCNLIAEIFNSAGLKTGMITTVNCRIGDNKFLNKSGKTMPGRFQLQKLLREMARTGCRYAIIETSSEGILQHRHRFIDYNMAVFTNLGFDHLERHGGFENYRAAKIKLFEKAAKKKDGFGVYNLDDKNVKYFLEPKINEQHLYTLELQKPTAGIQNLHKITGIKLNKRGAGFLFDGEKFETPLIGRFNVYNAAAAICVALSQKISIEQIKKSLAKAETVAGRMEKIQQGKNFSVFVDYAHTEDALREALFALASLKPKRIIAVFGCGGNRDKAKRPKMGRVASELADIVIITSDNPRGEDPGLILSEIKSGILNRFPKRNLYEILDRKEAIKKAISLAKKGDIILIAGKGHETRQIFKDKTIRFDDREVVRDILTNTSD